MLDISLSVLSAVCLLPPNDSLVQACLSIACILQRLQAPELLAQAAVYSNMSATAHCSSLCEFCSCNLLLPALVFAHILSCRHHGACMSELSSLMAVTRSPELSTCLPLARLKRLTAACSMSVMKTHLLRLLIDAVLASMAVSHHISRPRDLHCRQETAPEGRGLSFSMGLSTLLV